MHVCGGVVVCMHKGVHVCGLYVSGGVVVYSCMHVSGLYVSVGCGGI